MELSKMATIEDIIGENYTGLTDMYTRLATIMGIPFKEGYKFNSSKVEVSHDMAANLYVLEVQFRRDSIGIDNDPKYKELPEGLKKIIDMEIAKRATDALNAFGPLINKELQPGTINIVEGFVVDENGNDVLPDMGSTITDAATDIMNMLKGLDTKPSGNNRLN